MSGYTLFNRHANMSKETLYEIGDIISEVRWGGSFDLTNQLFGLYDGYLYDELLINAQDLPKPLFRRIIKVWAVVSKYPIIEYVAGVDEEDEGPEYDSAGFTEDDRIVNGEYRVLGVAEAKAYLASVS